MNNSTSINSFPYYNQFRVIQNLLVKISFPYIFLIAFIGFITNTSTVILLSKNLIAKNLKNKWTLIALALSDLIFNIALFTRGLHDIFKGGSNYLCIMISFLSHLAELLSAYYTVTFTIQRYTAVHYPLKAAVDHRSSPIISLLIIFLLSSIFCLLLCLSNDYIQCHEELKLSWFIADALFSFVIPFFLILIFNIRIVNFIRKHSRSPITVQSTISRKKKRFKNNFKGYHHDETFVTNARYSFNHSDDQETIELKTKKDEKKLPNESENQTHRPSISSSLDRLNSDSSSNRPSSRPVFDICGSSKNSSQRTRRLSHDSSIDRLSNKYISPSNDNDLVISISTRTSQSIRVTRMLVLVSTCFLILNAPAHLCVIALKLYTSINIPIFNENFVLDTHQQIDNVNHTTISSFQSEPIVEDGITIHILYVAVLLTQLIAYASYSINFFLYSFSGIAFRTSLRQLFKKFRTN